MLAVLLSLLEFVAQSVLHGGPILDRVLVLLEVEQRRLGVELHVVPHLVADLSFDLGISGVFEPNLDQHFVLASDGHAHADDGAVSELLSGHREQKLLPHEVDVLVVLDLDDPDTTVWTVFPHGHLVLSEEVDVDVLGQLAWSLEVGVVGEEVMHVADHTELLELISVRFISVFVFLFLLLLLLLLFLLFLVLVLLFDFRLSFEIPELPFGLEGNLVML